MTFQRPIFLIQKIILKNKTNCISQILKIRIINSILSVILRMLFRFNFFFRRYYLLREKIDINSLNEFWMVRIGFFRKRNFLPYINLDPYLINRPQLCSDLINLPLGAQT